MPIIRSLSQSMINKIAAGEVIERPASVVKELVENSIDAGATRIDISLENGGSNLIRIVDNGCGIEADQLSLALSPHATSKLTEVEDLFRILSFGFRGEALASVAEISQLTLKSRTANSNSGAMIQSNGGKHSEITSCGIPMGTQIEVRNLFFNTPVRRRYMKSVTTEFGHAAETFTRLVLPQSDIHFTLKHNDRIVHELPPANEPLSRIRQLFGDDIARDLIAIESPANASVRVSGFVSHPNQHRPNNRMQYFFLNRRFIRDRALQHALNEAYRGLLVSGRFPLAFLQIELSPDLFDVNVHPTKMEVRFLESNRIYSGFLSAIREKFLLSDLRSKFHASTERLPPPTPETNNPRDSLDPAAMEKKRQAVADWISQIPKADGLDHPLSPPKEGNYSKEYDSYRQSNRDDYSQLSLHRLPGRENRQKEGGYNTVRPPCKSESGEGNTAKLVSYHPGFTSERERNSPLPQEEVGSDDPLHGGQGWIDRTTLSPKGHIVVQMLQRYLVMETNEGIALIDQHALHERILYEQLKERMNSGHLESQRLLVPVPVDLSPNESSCARENIEFFKTLGLTVEPFGGNTVLISAFPAVLAKTLPEEILLSLLDSLLTSEKKLEQSELLDELLHNMACKAAIKAGDKLSSSSMQHLIHLAESEINAHHCPHGRPSTLIFTKEQIDKMFNRT